MQLQEHKKIYVPDDEIFSFQDTLLDNISFKVFVQCSKEKFLQYQKDILEEFVADFTNTIKTSEELDVIDIRDIFEQYLQVLNTKLKEFAEKVRDIEHFSLKWIIQLVVDDKLMSSMIGNVSMLVMRDQKTAYSVPNSVDTRSKIDLFSDFIEWNIERDDQLLYVGLKFADVMDAHDLKEMENLLAQEESSEWILSFLEELLTTRIEKSSIWFIISYFVQWPSINISAKSRKWWLKLKWWIKWIGWIKWKSIKYLSNLWEKVQNSERIRYVKEQLVENKIYVVGFVLVILMFIFLYSLASQILDNSNHTNKFKTSDGAYIDINLEDLQNDIAEFKTLDASSNLKSAKYTEISQKLEFLEEQWKWLEDVEDLKSQLQENYYDWFRITQFKTENELNNIAGKNTQILTFNSTDSDKLWTLNSINVPRDNYMMIAWSKWALIDAVSDTSRGYLQSYNLSKPLENCISALNSNWIYCYNAEWEIYMISKSGIIPVTTEDWDFRSWIWWLGTFSSRNLYVFNSNVSNLWNILLTRYQVNSDGTYANFKWWSSYSIAATGVDFWTFSSFDIDENFFGWANGKLYFFRREDWAWTSLEYRKMDIKWANPLTESYSDNVKIIVPKDSRYIYTYDKDQQLFTTYTTEPNRRNKDNKNNYQLVYLFSFKFNIEGTTIYDVDIPNSWDKPELYILSTSWVNKIPLYEYIESRS